MAIWYVNQQTGADTNDGKTQKTSFASIEKALIFSSNDDTISVFGEYNVVIKVPPPPNTYKVKYGISITKSITLTGNSSAIMNVSADVKNNGHCAALFDIRSNVNFVFKNFYVKYDISKINSMGGTTIYAPVFITNWGGSPQASKTSFLITNNVIEMYGSNGVARLGAWYTGNPTENEKYRNNLFISQNKILFGSPYSGSIPLGTNAFTLTPAGGVETSPGGYAQNVQYNTGFQLLNADNTKFGVHSGAYPWQSEAHYLFSNGKYYSIDVDTAVEVPFDNLNGFKELTHVTKNIVDQLTPPVKLLHVNSNGDQYFHKDVTVQFPREYNRVNAKIELANYNINYINQFSNSIEVKEGAYIKYFFKFEDSGWVGIDKTTDEWVSVDIDDKTSIDTYGITIVELNTLSSALNSRFVTSQSISYGFGVFLPNKNSRILYNGLQFKRGITGEWKTLAPGVDYEEYMSDTYYRYVVKNKGTYKVNTISKK